MPYRSSMELALTVAVMCLFGCASEAESSASSGGAGARAGASGAGAAAVLPNAAASGAGGSAAKNEGCSDSQVECNGACLSAGSEGGGCKVLAATGNGVDVQRIALDDSHVYWAEQGIRTAVARAPKAGGGREQLIETESLPGELAVSSSNVIWSEGITTHSLRMISKSGGMPVTLVPSIDEVSAIMATSTRVYVATGFSANGQGVLESVGLESMDRMAHGAADVWPNAAWIAADDRALYWTAPAGIRATTLTGQDLKTLTSPGLNPVFLLMNNNVYVAHGNEGEKSLSRIAADSGETTLLYAGPEVAGLLGASGTTLYFGYPSVLYALAPGAAKPEVAFKTSSQLRYWVADDSGIYAALGTKGGETLILKVR